MANDKKRIPNPKRSYGYRANETDQKRAIEKARKLKITLSSRIEQFVKEWGKNNEK